MLFNVNKSLKAVLFALKIKIFRSHKISEIFQADELLSNPENMKNFLKEAHHKKNKKPIEKLMQLVKDGVKLGYSLSGQNTTDFEDKTMKLFSPRFMGVVPEEKQPDEVNYLKYNEVVIVYRKE